MSPGFGLPIRLVLHVQRVGRQGHMLAYREPRLHHATAGPFEQDGNASKPGGR